MNQPHWNDSNPASESPNLGLGEAFRAQMPVAKKWAYFDHAAVGPLSGPAASAIERFTSQACGDGDLHWLSWAQGLRNTRQTFARNIGASETEIAFVANTTDGINRIAQGMPWKAGDNIVLPAGEFPSNHYPWRELKDLGVELRVVPTGERGEFDAADIARHCDSNTRLISVSWVGFASGFRCDLDAISEVAQRFRSRLFVDAIQGLGVFPLDVRQTPIDFLSADGHKWMLGPEGLGVLYVKAEHITTLKPTQVGWNSVVNPFDYQSVDQSLRTDAQRFEGGSHNLLAAQALGASLSLLEQVGWGATSQALANRVLEISRALCEILLAHGARVYSERSPRYASGIVSFSFENRDPIQFRKDLIDRGIILSCRAGRLRAALHGYNDRSDLERLDQALRELLG